jgi:F-type H+-transporting ATPase subunit epsilon
MRYSDMQVKILLPFRVFVEKKGILGLLAESEEGAFGILPNRRDCVVGLCPGILSLKTSVETEEYIALDEGVLVKSGNQILISVRNAIGGVDLSDLHKAVEREFLHISEEEKSLRNTLAKLEVGFVRRFTTLKKDHK